MSSLVCWQWGSWKHYSKGPLGGRLLYSSKTCPVLLHLQLSAGLDFHTRALIHVITACYQPERNLWNLNLLFDFFICQKISSYHDFVQLSLYLWWPAKGSTYYSSLPWEIWPPLNKCHYFLSTQFISESFHLIPSWINCIWVKSPFIFVSFDISAPLHHDYKNWVFHFLAW